MARRFFGKRVKAPVLSRLFLVWSATAATVVGATLFVLEREPTPALTIALTDAPPERMARPPERLTQPQRQEKRQEKRKAALAPTATSVVTIGEQRPRATPAMDVSLADAIDDGVSFHHTAPTPEGAVGASAFGDRGSSVHERRSKLVRVERSSSIAIDPYAEDAGFEPMAGGGDVVITVDGRPAKPIGQPNAKGRRVTPPKPIAAIDPSLRRKTEYGAAPGIASTGLKPSDIYIHRFRPNEHPNVALIIGGLGLDQELTRRAIEETPAAVSLAFAPYAKDLQFWTDRARKAGHEILLELPMEQSPKNEANLGPAALMTSRAREENLQRLEWLLSRFDGYFAATNYLGAHFSGDRAAIGPVLARLRASGLAYFDDTGAVLRFTDTAARDVASVSRVIPPNAGDPGADLALLERIAKRDGLALGKAYASAGLFDEISAWAWSLEDKQLTLAPASAVLALKKSEL
ncbi:MAG: divergent polysaccharide deacetylase family protein [Pseudomonadota bacterium]